MIRPCCYAGMLYETPALEPVDKGVLEETEEMRRDLK
jgi:hypothetical protein